MKKIGFHSYFLKGNSKLELLNFVKGLIHLNDYKIESPQDVDSNWQSIGENISNKMLLLTGKGEQIININSMQAVDFVFFRLLIDLDRCKAFADAISRLSGFLFLQIYDSEDQYWESETDIQSYEFAGKDYTFLPKSIDLIGQECIDISSNYGRTIRVGEIMILASPINYFGTHFFNLISKEYLLNFNSYIMKEETSELLKCILFSDVFKSKENRISQKKFWKYLKLDELSFLVKEIYPYTEVPFDSKIDDRIKLLYSFNQSQP